MFLLACLLAVAAAAPAVYDQRQDGELNVRADVSNILFVIAVPKGLPGYFKSVKPNRDLQERSDSHVMEAFVEPSEPYHVEIGESSRNADGGSQVEVVIAGRRRLETEAQAEPEQESHEKEPEQQQQDEYKLLGATEQCGPDAERDPDTLACRARSQLPAESAPSPQQPDEKQKPEEKPKQKPAAAESPEVIPAPSSS